MATGCDKLLDFLLAEIALCGTQGAGSADLIRFLEKYQKENSTSDSVKRKAPQIGRAFIEKVWGWVTKHPDIRITNEGQICQFSLPEFEAAEIAITGKSKSVASTVESSDHDASTSVKRQPPASLLNLREALRQRLSEEGAIPRSGKQDQTVTGSHVNGADINPSDQENGLATSTIPRHPRHNLPEPVHTRTIIFDEPSTTVRGPRLHASQNRVWRALTGHDMDLKKVPSMEFALLSIIAAHGAAGITQPELTQLSGQDKRSVPKRTDELARKGYIVKNPVQSGKIRTSICAHSKFVSQDHYLVAAEVDDVFKEGTFVVAGFAHLLYNKLKDSGVVPTRDIRMKLGVPMRTWNKRAVQGALIRLDQSGMIKRCRIRKKTGLEKWVICIRVLREPRHEDIENLGFRKQISTDDPNELPLEDGEGAGDGDAFMKDLELDILDDNDAEDNVTQPVEDTRIQPRWVPERLLTNSIFDVTATGLDVGVDGLTIRDSIIGPFWRRPMETLLTRITDDWQKSQPPHLRHLAVVRDTRTTNEKRFIHYVYRTFDYFKQAVEAGEVSWEGASKDHTKKLAVPKTAQKNLVINEWGFLEVNKKDFLRSNGTASLKDARAVIVDNRYGPRWDLSLIHDEFSKSGSPKANPPLTVRDELRARLNTYSSPHNAPRLDSHEPGADSDSEDVNESGTPRQSLSGKRPYPTLELTPEQRISMGLKPIGRVSQNAIRQIITHRRLTGDPTSLPDRVVERTAKSIPKEAPLMSREERIAANLPPRGRLGLEAENRIRAERGLPQITEKSKKPRTKNGPTVLTKQQRIALGLKPHGRLHQDFIEALRKEREDDIPLEESPAVKAYLETLKLKESQTAAQKSQDNSPRTDATPREATEPVEPVPEGAQDSGNNPPPAFSPSAKRKANDDEDHPSPLKKQRTGSISVAEGITEAPHSPIRANSTIPDADHGGPAGGSSIPHAYDTPNRNSSGEPASVLATILKARRTISSNSRSISYTLDDASGPRDSPGVYIYASAKRNTGRGRPRNAFIVVFRLPSLHTLSWFQDEASRSRRTSVVSLTASHEASRNSLTMRNEDQTNIASYGTTDIPVSSLDHASLLNGKDNLEVGMPGAPTIDGPQNGPAEDKVINESTKTLEMRETCEIGAVAEPSEQFEQEISHSSPRSASQQTGESAMPSNGDPTSLRTVPAFSTNNMVAPASGSTYRSPYAPSTPGVPTRESRTQGALDPANVAEDNRPSTATSTSVAILPEGIVGVPAEVNEREESAKFKSRSVGAGLAGSHVKFRQAIIQDIIDRCGGVYPLHGEIWRPFSSLWDERHGHTKIKKPINSTVFDTLRDMIDRPGFDLKRMSFYVKARNAVGAKQRVMVARKDIAPNDPRVLRLAYNMANNALPKSHQYFPEEIRGLFDYESYYVPIKIAPKDESLVLDQLYPELEANIRDNRLRRQRAIAEQKKLEKAAAKAQNDRVVEVLPAQRAKPLNDAPREKRTRLASLNDKNKRYRRAVVQVPIMNLDTERGNETAPRSSSPAPSDSSDDVPLMLLHSRTKDVQNTDANDTRASADESDMEVQPVPHTESAASDELLATMVSPTIVSFTHPIIYFQPLWGTFATSFSLNIPKSLHQAKSVSSKKRVRIEEPAVERPSKRSRTIKTSQRKESLDSEFVYSSSDDSDVTSSEDDEEIVQAPRRQSKKRAGLGKRQLGKNYPDPTLLERLTGLTGDPNDPIWKDPKLVIKTYRTRSWDQLKRQRVRGQQKQRQYAESFDPVDRFKKLFCTLTLASSMSGDESIVVWSIVSKVYARDKFFELSMAKKLWIWIQKNLSSELTEFVHTFQSQFLEAYGNGRLPEIEDTGSYDWSGVVRWMMRTCPYPEIPLPMQRQALEKFDVDESSYAALDRSSWYTKKLADTKRTQLQLQTCFVAPMHRRRTMNESNDDKILKARSWTRANIATPQAMYDSNKAHDKLKVIGEDVLVKVVEEFVQHEQLKMRKLKRQLPGRNYTFTKKFAQAYRRPFELDDFMAAVHVKKQLDAAFSSHDADKRFYNIKRSEEDGALMAIMSLASGGQVNLVAQLPNVDHTFSAPLPRLSKWGFCEGDYVHRAIDRGRFFWDVHVVPTSDYKFGNPLQPRSPPPSPMNELVFTDWSALPDPPLPGREDPDALLPIWSSIDGQTVTWTWWYRILNLVLQPLYRQPGATAVDLTSNCANHATEVFEVQLVLDWLETVGAVSKLESGGYQAAPNFWAAFGDKLRDTEDDWFGDHVKRRASTKHRQQWREKYNERYSQALRDAHRGCGDGSTIPTGDAGAAVSEMIVTDARKQYSILQNDYRPEADSGSGTQQTAAAPEDEAVTTNTGNSANSTLQHTEDTQDGNHDGDMEMVDADAEGEDMDADGEVDEIMS